MTGNGFSDIPAVEQIPERRSALLNELALEIASPLQERDAEKCAGQKGVIQRERFAARSRA